MLRGRRRGAFRVPRPPVVPQLGHMEYYAAQENLLPKLMKNRLTSWGKPGNEIDPQLDCVLYDGRIPQEITDLIFQYVLLPDYYRVDNTRGSLSRNPAHEFCVRNDHKRSGDEPEIQLPSCDENQADNEAVSTANDQVGNDLPGTVLPGHHQVVPDIPRLPAMSRRRELGFDWLRPDCNHKPTYSGQAVLQTCRRVYSDAHDFLARDREIVVFEGREPQHGYALVDLIQRVRESHAQPQFQRVPSIHMYTQMYRLERTVETLGRFRALHGVPGNNDKASDVHRHLRSLLASGGSPAEPVWRMLHDLESFHLTLRRTDWDRWEDNKALATNPYRGHPAISDHEQMQRDMHASMVEGTEQRFEERGWGRMFRKMANLKELSITFETSEDKQAEMEEIVEWARTWRFEIMSWRHWLLRDNEEVMAYLVADDKPVKKTSWRGLSYHWSDSCPSCSTSTSTPRNDCPYCQKREMLLRDGRGPRILTWTRTWTRRLVEPPVDLRDTETRLDPEAGTS